MTPVIVVHADNDRLRYVVTTRSAFARFFDNRDPAEWLWWPEPDARRH